MIKISPSQIKAYMACPCKYSWEYVEKVKPPSNVSQEFGLAVHKHLEEWLSNGVMPEDVPSGRVALQGISVLPTPNDKLLIEKEMLIKINEEISVSGRIDCVDLSEDIPLIIDHKTTTSNKWIMTADQLLHDVQAILYAIWAMMEYNVAKVQIKWIYYIFSKTSKTPSGVLPVSILFNAYDTIFIDKIEAIDGMIGEMVEIRNKKIAPCDLIPNKNSCSTYGGCFHYTKCKELFRI